MANKDNHRRAEEKRTEHGPRWENGITDRNSANSRKKWKRRAARTERRTGTVTKKYHGKQDRRRHSIKPEEPS